MTPKALFLDDERHPEDVTWLTYPEGLDWVIVRTVQEFHDTYRPDVHTIVSFDHDLGTPATGADAAKYLAELHVVEHLPLPQVFLHSQNQIGRKNIESWIETARRVIQRQT